VAVANDNTKRTENAYLGGGCFWCIEAVYERIDGVISAVSGYAGGKTANPTYEAVSSGKTGHAEVVRIEFDPAKISYEAILDLFWKSHNPTTANRQGADVGSQYRSIILYESEEQQKKVRSSMQKLVASGKYRGPIVTELVPLQKFTEAEGYHQDYYDKNPTAGYCTFVIGPKLQKMELQVAPLTRTR
jgi:peptide-methionine (S)-S-oxide reductase